MIKLTAPDGSESRLDGSEVVRVRRATHEEDTTGISKTRVDWVELMMVREEPDAVAALVRTELNSLAELALPDGSPVWFNAKKVDARCDLSLLKRRVGAVRHDYRPRSAIS